MDKTKKQIPNTMVNRSVKHPKTTEIRDEEAPKREVPPPWSWIVFVVAAGLGLFHLYTGGFGALSSMSQRAVHWTGMAILAFLLYPSSKKRPQLVPTDILWATCAATSGVYILLNWKRIVDNAGVTNQTDFVFGIVMIIIVLAATYRVIGPVLTGVAGAFLLYALLGQYLPGNLAHRGYYLERVVAFLYSSTEGIFGIPMNVSATYVALFVLFGSFLNSYGGGQFFVDLAYSLTGRLRGGAAKTSVVSSALMGTISGSAVANVVTTGTFTIPLMKRSGYPSHIAGAVEAVASTGGQIMPPVMGAAAFMMAEIIGIPYVTIMKAAILPALLYFTAVFIMVDLEAVKNGIRALPSSDLPDFGSVMKAKGVLIVPLVVLIYAIVRGISPMKAVFFSVASVLAIAIFFERNPKAFISKFATALTTGIKNVISVAVACAASGIVVGIIAMTGLGLKLSAMIVSLSGNVVLLALVLTMLASLVLGTGLPTTAAYLVLATLGVPALEKLGVSTLAAHMFVFYFGCISTITPPVALSAYAGAALSGANPNKVGWTAVKLGVVAFIVPYMFVYGPSLLLQGNTADILVAAVTALIGVFAISIAVEGFFIKPLSVVEKAASALAGLLMIHPGVVTDVPGIILLILVIFFQRLKPGTAAQTRYR